MKVLFVSRSTIFSLPGGDTNQMVFSAKYLKNYGVEVDFYTDDFKPNYEEYDLIHYYNITRPSIILDQIKKTNKKYLITSIFVDYSFYSKISGNFKMKWLTKIFGTDGIEYLKRVAKHFLRNEKIEFLPYFWLGQKRSIKKILNKAEYVLPNSESEIYRLESRYNIEFKSKVIPNGVDFEKFIIDNSIYRNPKQVICVGLIEPRKNQLNLIKAINDSDFTLKIIGNPAPNHLGYFEKCKKIASDNITFIFRITQEELAIHYQESEIHILPSWFETTGLVSLEAAYLGCKIVVSPMGDTEEYFKDFAQYCEPDSIDSIKLAIDNAHKMEYSDGLKNLIISEYNWQQAAKKTYEVYCETLNLAQ